MRQYIWKDTQELFQKLNQTCNYVILRNYEEIGEKEFLMDAHPDIDLLCDNSKKLKKQLKIVKNPGHIRHADHYWVKIGDRMVEIGVRYVGDLYYDTEWEKHMLDKKILHTEGFYVMDEENYFYSLLYHAYFQKKKLSEDYPVRFQKMARAIGISAATEQESLAALFQYMKEKSYFVTCPKDITIPMQYDKIPEDMLQGKKEWERRRLLCIPVRVVRFISRRILK